MEDNATSSSPTTTTSTTTESLPCRTPLSYQSAEFALPCEAGVFEGYAELERGVERELLRLPAGAYELTMSLLSEAVDVDIYVHQAATDECLLGYSCSLTSEAMCDWGLSQPCSIGPKAVMSFGGHDDDVPVNETVRIWEVEAELVVYAVATKPGPIRFVVNHGDAPQSCFLGWTPPPGCRRCFEYTGCEAPLAAQCNGTASVECFDPRTTTTMPSTTMTIDPNMTTTTTTTTRAWECIDDLEEYLDNLTDVTNPIVLKYDELVFDEVEPGYFQAEIVQELSRLGVSESATAALEIRMCPGSVIAQIFGPNYAMWEVLPLPLDFVRVNGTYPRIILGAPTTTTTTTRFQGIPCTFSNWRSSDKVPAEYSGSNCPYQMQENETCTITCKSGQAMGELRCFMGNIVGSPLCAEEGTEVFAVTKIAAAMFIDAQLPAGSTIRSPLLPEVILGVLATAIGVRVEDFTLFKVGTPVISVQFELVVHDTKRTAELKRALGAMAMTSNSGNSNIAGLGPSFSRTLLYHGIRVRHIGIVHPPTSFQEMAISRGPMSASQLLDNSEEYNLSTGVIAAGFVVFMCGLPIVACAVHSVVHNQQKRSRGRASTDASARSGATQKGGSRAGGGGGGGLLPMFGRGRTRGLE